MKPIRLDVIAPVFQTPGFCTACELILSEAGVSERRTDRSFDEYPEEWKEDVQRLSDWVYDVAGRYGNDIVVRVIDAQSPEGLLKGLRHRVRRYPTWLVNGKKRVVGWDRESLEAALAAAREEGRV